LVACKLPDTERVNEKIVDAVLPNQTADTIDVVYSEHGIIKMRLRAPFLIMKESNGEQYNEFPNGIEIDFFNKDGEKNGDLVADSGVDDPANRERYVKGNVVINSKDGTVYETDELYINEEYDSVHNNGLPVKLTKQDGTILQGDSFESNSRLEFIRIKNLFDSAVPIENDQLK